MLEVITGLIQKGHAYEVGGDVYFRVKSKPDYGKLSHRTLDGMLAGARIEVGEAKENPLDFALWKAAKPGEPQWRSPWGQGRPGWHIECTAMSLKYLGETLDIHGGGQDLIFPHHENEIAQSESFTGVKPFVRYWIHNGLLQLGEEKMSKSTGKLIGISEVLAKYSADAIRLWVLSSHYRSPITYSDENLTATEKGVERLRNTDRLDVKESATVAIDAQPYKERFNEAMEDDFGTPQAIAALFDLAREINRGNDEGLNIGLALNTFRELAGVLGMILSSVPSHYKIELRALIGVAAKYEVDIKDVAESDSIIKRLSDKRLELRSARKYRDADNIRGDLKQLGITLEDTPQGTVWRYKKP
jgi:cysteinyl-tRNA synthetase